MEQKIKLSSGSDFPVKWAGVGTFDNVLRFEVVGSDTMTLVTRFVSLGRDEVITHVFDETKKTEYRGYNKFIGISESSSGNHIVSMGVK